MLLLLFLWSWMLLGKVIRHGIIPSFVGLCFAALPERLLHLHSRLQILVNLYLFFLWLLDIRRDRCIRTRQARSLQHGLV